MYSLHTALNLPQCTDLGQVFPLSRDGYSSMTEKHDMYELSYAFVVVRPLEVQITEMGRDVMALDRLQALVNNGLML
jgi:hypothetical protein